MTRTQPHVGTPRGGSDPDDPLRDQLTTEEILWEFLCGLILVGLIRNLIRLAGSSNRVLAPKKLLVNLVGSTVTVVLGAVLLSAILMMDSGVAESKSPVSRQTLVPSLDPSLGPVLVPDDSSDTQASSADHNGTTPNPLGTQSRDERPEEFLSNIETIRALAFQNHDASYLDHVYAPGSLARSGDQVNLEDGISTDAYEYDDVSVESHTDDAVTMSYRITTGSGTSLKVRTEFVYLNGEWLISTERRIR